MGVLSRIRVQPGAAPNLGVDNELIIMLFNNTGSQVIAHLKSAKSFPIQFTTGLAGVLPAGAYTLQLIGINWWLPSSFNVDLTIDGVIQNLSFANASGATGVVWTPKLQVTIPA
jgi:hypothetical protein